jgi:hypothetical protein
VLVVVILQNRGRLKQIKMSKMKKKFAIIFLTLFALFRGYSQAGMAEISYTKLLLDSKNLGEMTAPNLFEIGLGWAGNGIIPYGCINLGYISMEDNVASSLPNPSTYQSLMVGGKLGIRPFANIWVTRFQPIIQFGAKTTFKVTSVNETTKETEQLFSNGNTKVYEPAKIVLYSSCFGFEYYLGKRFAITVLGNYDHVTIEDLKFNNYSASVGLRQYF